MAMSDELSSELLEIAQDMEEPGDIIKGLRFDG